MKKLTIFFAFIVFAWFGVQQAQAVVDTAQNVLPCVPTVINPCTNLTSPEGSLPTLLSPATLVKKPLRPGATGLAVKELQQILHDKGYLGPKDPIDGKFGTNTKKAIIEIQKLTGVKKIDGVVGEETMKKIENVIEKEETITLAKKNNKNTVLKNYACKEQKKEEMFVGWGEVINETTNSIYRMADMWSTLDGVNWSQKSYSLSTGEKWEPMVVNKNGTVYVLGGKYKKDSSANDNSVYKSTDMVNWSYVGELPDLSRYYDKSVIYFKGKFWLTGVDNNNNNHEDISGVWSSADGSNWKQEVTKTLWDSKGRVSAENNKGRYDSNTLGLFTLDGKKMFYLVQNSDEIMMIYSTTNGKDWTKEGPLVNSKDNTYFKIGINTNPAPVIKDGKVWIVSTMQNSTQAIVINSNDGVHWNLVSNSTTDFPLGYYSSDVVFNDKLWKIGGWNYTSGNDNGIYSSSDGVKWEKVTTNNTNFPDAKDRHLAGYTVLSGVKTKATNLQIARKYNSTGWFTGSDEKGRTMGEWNLTANSDKNTKNTGPVTITELSFVGNNYTSSLGYEISTLETLGNVTIYINDKQVGSVSKFNGPFFDKSGKTALTQTIKLDTPYTLNKGESVWVKMTADFPKPKFGNIEYRTFLNGIGFKDGYTTPCLIYNEEKSDGYASVPGANLYYKDAKLPN